MLERKRATLVCVAFKAGFFVDRRLADKGRATGHAPRGRECAMRIMAIGTIHKTFIHPMFERHGKVGANVRMTAIAKGGLCFSE
jgi:hypothetical protein